MLRLLANGFAIASISSNILELINLLFTVCVTALVPFTVTQERMFLQHNRYLDTQRYLKQHIILTKKLTQRERRLMT